jgi:hypothetical protein
MEGEGGISKFRRPEYTGENRCLPCTAVNVVLGAAASILVGAVVAALVSPAAAVPAGAGTFAVCLASIYLRGYLVPGTPTLTKRYFPARVLAWFGKKPAGSRGRDGELDPETELTAIDALQECPDGPDLCLTDGFREAWQAEIRRVKDTEAGREELLALLDADGDVGYEEFGDAFRARVDGVVAGKWESRAAFLADLGGANALADRHPEWDLLTLRERSQLLNGLRLFLDTCPTCGGTPEFGTDTVESCCSMHEVAAVSCEDCGARLFESAPL